MKDFSNARFMKTSATMLTAAMAVVVGLSACGKFSAIDPKAKGTSTNANPLAAEEENRLRELMAEASATPAPGASQAAGPAAGAGSGAGRSEEDREAALDEARRVFGAELDGRAAAPAGQPAGQAAGAVAQAGSGAERAAGQPDGQPVGQAAAGAGQPDGQQAGAGQAGAPPPAAIVITPPPAAAIAPASAASKALIAADVSDEAKRDMILELVEPTMRINFVLSMQRNEILAMKAVLDAKKELSPEQAAKLSKFKQSFLLLEGDSIEALLTRVDVVNMTLQVAPFLLKSNWQPIDMKEVATRVQALNTYPSDESVRFRSARLALKGTGEKPTSRKIMMAEIGYDPSAKDENAEKVLATIDEALRIMSLYSPVITAKINETSSKLIAEFSKK